jgi:hypothetical protein
LGLTFFGLTPDLAPQIRVNVFKQIHEILFHGKGGYDYNTIYNMPLWLRKFTFNEIKMFYEKEEAAYKNQQEPGKTSLIDADGKVNVQQFKNASKDYKGKSSYK